jgi:hypothetical protein
MQRICRSDLPREDQFQQIQVLGQQMQDPTALTSSVRIKKYPIMLNHPSFIKTEEPQTYPLVSRTPFKKNTDHSYIQFHIVLLLASNERNVL